HADLCRWRGLWLDSGPSNGCAWCDPCRCKRLETQPQNGRAVTSSSYQNLFDPRGFFTLTCYQSSLVSAALPPKAPFENLTLRSHGNEELPWWRIGSVGRDVVGRFGRCTDAAQGSGSGTDR